MYPNPLECFPEAWVEELAAITSPEDVVRLEKKDFRGLVHAPDLVKFYQRHRCRRMPLPFCT